MYIFNGLSNIVYPDTFNDVIEWSGLSRGYLLSLKGE
jgi:hypothetical protein